MIGVVASLIIVILPISVGKFYELLFDLSSTRGKLLFFIPEWVIKSEVRFLIFFIFLVILRFVSSYFEKLLKSYLGEELAFYLRNKIFEHQLFVPWSAYEKRGVGKYLLRYSGDLNSIKSYLSKGVLGFVNDLIMVLMIIAGLLVLHFQMAITLLLFIVLLMLPIKLLNGKLSQVASKNRNLKAGLLAFVSQELNAFVSIKFFNKEPTELRKFEKRAKEVLKEGKSYYNIYHLIHSFIPVSIYLFLSLVFSLVIYLKYLDHPLPNPADFLMAILLIISTFSVFRRLLKVPSIWYLGNISFSKLIRVLNLPLEKTNKTSVLHYKKGLIEFKGVKLNISKNGSPTEPIDIKLTPKKTTAFFTNSGALNYSIVKAIFGIESINEGVLLFDNQDMSEVSPDSIRKKITLVFDELPLFGNSVFEAVSYSRKLVKRDKAKELLDVFQKGIDTKSKLTLDDKIGELGRNLSSDQRKILAYVRAFLTDKPTVVIVEPFRGLNEESKSIIEKEINNIWGKKTILIIQSNPKTNKLVIDEMYNFKV